MHAHSLTPGSRSPLSTHIINLIGLAMLFTCVAHTQTHKHTLVDGEDLTLYIKPPNVCKDTRFLRRNHVILTTDRHQTANHFITWLDQLDQNVPPNSSYWTSVFNGKKCFCRGLFIPTFIKTDKLSTERWREESQRTGIDSNCYL